MIEIKMVLYDGIELNMLSQLQQMLDQKRAQDNARQFEQPHPPLGEPIPQEPVDTSKPDAYVDHYVEAVQPDAPAAAEPTSAPVPSDIEVARAITEYSQRAGVPKARELIESFGVKNAMAVPDERRAEFVEKTRTEGL